MNESERKNLWQKRVERMDSILLCLSCRYFYRAFKVRPFFSVFMTVTIPVVLLGGGYYPLRDESGMLILMSLLSFVLLMMYYVMFTYAHSKVLPQGERIRKIQACYQSKLNKLDGSIELNKAWDSKPNN